VKIARNLLSKQKAADFSELLPLFLSYLFLPFRQPSPFPQTMSCFCSVHNGQRPHPEGSPSFFEIVSVLHLFKSLVRAEKEQRARASGLALHEEASRRYREDWLTSELLISFLGYSARPNVERLSQKNFAQQTATAISTVPVHVRHTII